MGRRGWSEEVRSARQDLGFFLAIVGLQKTVDLSSTVLQKEKQ